MRKPLTVMMVVLLSSFSFSHHDVVVGKDSSDWDAFTLAPNEELRIQIRLFFGKINRTILRQIDIRYQGLHGIIPISQNDNVISYPNMFVFDISKVYGRPQIKLVNSSDRSLRVELVEDPKALQLALILKVSPHE